MIVAEAERVTPVVRGPEDDPIVGVGPVSALPLLAPGEAAGWAAALNTFAPGAMLNWHTHDSEQIIFVTEGEGIVATKDEERVLRPGTVVFVAAGEVHRHGASAHSSLTHFNIQRAGIHLAE
jgi:quercetin dioxygenase-like cupin family protein